MVPFAVPIGARRALRCSIFQLVRAPLANPFILCVGILAKAEGKVEPREKGSVDRRQKIRIQEDSIAGGGAKDIDKYGMLEFLKVLVGNKWIRSKEGKGA